MDIELAANSYGKSRVRLVRVTRHAEQHELKDIAVDIQLEGDFGAVHTHGDNRQVLATDTMKNTVYVLAAEKPVGEIEDFGRRLIIHFLAHNPQISQVRIHIAEQNWGRITVQGRPHPSAFIGAGNERRTTAVTGTRDTISLQSGLEGLLLLRTAGSAFAGYIKDPYTTLPETSDRIFCTVVKAQWSYAPGTVHFGECWNGVRSALLETFATHDSQSAQHTLYAMAEAALQSCGALSEIWLSLPNRHHVGFDLSRFDIPNRNEVFVPTDEPFGLIEATVRRK